MNKKCFEYIISRVEADVQSSRAITEIHIPKGLYKQWDDNWFFPKYESFGVAVKIVPTVSNCDSTVRVFLKGRETCAHSFVLPPEYIVVPKHRTECEIMAEEVLMQELVVNYTRLKSCRDSQKVQVYKDRIQYINRTFGSSTRIQKMLDYLESTVGAI